MSGITLQGKQITIHRRKFLCLLLDLKNAIDEYRVILSSAVSLRLEANAAAAARSQAGAYLFVIALVISNDRGILRGEGQGQIQW